MGDEWSSDWSLIVEKHITGFVLLFMCILISNEEIQMKKKEEKRNAWGRETMPRSWLESTEPETLSCQKPNPSIHDRCAYLQWFRSGLISFILAPPFTTDAVETHLAIREWNITICHIQCRWGRGGRSWRWDGCEGSDGRWRRRGSGGQEDRWQEELHGYRWKRMYVV